MEPFSFRICLPEKPEWRSARVRFCEVIVCKQGQVFAAAFILLWLAGGLSLWKDPSCGTAHLSQVQLWMHTDIWCYARSIIFSMSIFLQTLCSMLFSHVGHENTAWHRLHTLAMWRSCEICCVGLIWECRSRALPHQYTWKSLCSAAKSCVSSNINSALDACQNYNAVKFTSFRFLLY